MLPGVRPAAGAAAAAPIHITGCGSRTFGRPAAVSAVLLDADDARGAGRGRAGEFRGTEESVTRRR
jgi:hypothetical protein